MTSVVAHHAKMKYGVHVRGPLQLVRQMRTPVLQLRKPRLRVVRVHPVLVRTLLLRALAVELGQILPRGRRDP